MNNEKVLIEVYDPSSLSTNPLVSVYMLAYRHERFIAQAIEGVIAQQCNFQIELIIGEDCSPDRTGEIARDYQKRYPQLIRILTSEKNVGAYANARRCLLATRGKYVAICEGDDFWHHPHKLQMQVDLMDKHPSMAVCHTDFDRLTKFRSRRDCHKKYPSPWLAKGEAYIALLHEWSVMTATSVYRKDVLMAFVGSIYDIPTWPFGDRNKLLFASLIGPFGYIDQSTATFRKRVGSASNSGTSANLKMAQGNLECIELFMSTNPPDESTRIQALINMYRWVYDAAFYACRIDVMNDSFLSLRSLENKMSRWPHLLRQLAVTSKAPVKIMNFARNLVMRFVSGM